MSQPSRQQGVSLIELMIALSISTFLMLGVFEIFVGSSGTDRVAHAFARVQESGRLALDIMSRDLRMTGYQGCIDPAMVDMNIIADDAPTYDLGNEAISGYEAGTDAWTALVTDPSHELSKIPNASGIPTGSDIVYIHYTNPTGVSNVCQGSSPNASACEAVNANVKIANNSIGLTKYDAVVISDCANADLFRITNMTKDGDGMVNLAHSNSNNSSNNLSKAYGEDAQVMMLKSVVYYVKDSGRKDSQGNAVYALYQFDPNWHDSGGTITGRELELVEGVENLQLLYGQRRDDGNVNFLPADDSNLDFANVEALRIGLLVAAAEPVLTESDESSYLLLDTTVAKAGEASAETTHAIDRRLRRVFTTTLFLRNRSR